VIFFSFFLKKKKKKKNHGTAVEKSAEIAVFGPRIANSERRNFAGSCFRTGSQGKRRVFAAFFFGLGGFFTVIFGFYFRILASFSLFFGLIRRKIAMFRVGICRLLLFLYKKIVLLVLGVYFYFFGSVCLFQNLVEI
jgi:hypothetical protein